MNNDSSDDLEIFLRQVRAGALKYTEIRVRNEDTALDILQDTMMGFVKVVDRYEPAAWQNLFYKILNRRITDWLRKLIWRNRLVQIIPFSQYSAQMQHPQDPSPEPEFAASEETEAHFHAQRLAELLQTALAKLPARQQEAYLLRQWQGLSTQETAQIMSCSPGSVKTHLSRAMSTLKGLLGDWVNET